MSILIVGGAGYIGSHVNKYLNAAGYETVVVDNLSRGHRGSVCWGEFFEGDIGDREFIDGVFESRRIDAVMHFAAYAYVGESVSQPAEYYNNNITKTLTLLDSMVQHEVNNFVFSSTCATFGQAMEIPITETHPQNPINPYGFTKLVIERALRDYGEAYGLLSCVFRYFNASGADPDGVIGELHEPETHLIPIILDVALGRRDVLRVFGGDYPTADGTCIRDYIHVQDLAEAHRLGLERLWETGKSDDYNLGCGKGYSVKEAIDIASRVTGCEIPVSVVGRREGDPPVLVGSGVKAVSLLGWRPRFSLEDSIVTAWRWQRKLAAAEAEGGGKKDYLHEDKKTAAVAKKAVSRGVNYKDAGVDLELYAESMSRLPSLVGSTFSERVIRLDGGFAGLYKLAGNDVSGRYDDPVLVSCTDGVGTKLRVATMANRHGTVGIDLVAMSVNDAICCGAEPLFFLDYVAMPKDDPDLLEEIVGGIVLGCREAGCSLLGGETAILSGVYRQGDYDLAGFCVGVVERKNLLDGGSIGAGDVLIGVESSGLHSNGFSLARKIVFDIGGMSPTDKVPIGVAQFAGQSVSELLLTPTRIYVSMVLRLLKKYGANKGIRGIAHITGGGLLGNLTRILPSGLAVNLEEKRELPPVFEWLQKIGNVDSEEMSRVFNLGTGLVLVVQADKAEEIIKETEFKSYRIGNVINVR
ncbi:MAG: UDP-glucose 4-epimerase GalE [Planctomycetaceae bacterium]|nr:UDP-glucose 4-epimerase GalE [Planctomycetaceae bacterium]